MRIGLKKLSACLQNGTTLGNSFVLAVITSKCLHGSSVAFRNICRLVSQFWRIQDQKTALSELELWTVECPEEGLGESLGFVPKRAYSCQRELLHCSRRSSGFYSKSLEHPTYYIPVSTAILNSIWVLGLICKYFAEIGKITKEPMTAFIASLASKKTNLRNYLDDFSHQVEGISQ